MRLTDEQLQRMHIDPNRRSLWARCPWCGELIVWGYRKSNGAQQVNHDGIPDPRTGMLLISCEPFMELVMGNQHELMRQLTTRCDFRPLTG